MNNLDWFRDVAHSQRNANFSVNIKTGDMRVESRSNPLQRMISWIRSKITSSDTLRREREAAYNAFLRAIGEHAGYREEDVTNATGSCATEMKEDKPLSARTIMQVMEDLDNKLLPAERDNMVKAKYYSKPEGFFSESIQEGIQERPLLCAEDFKLTKEQSTALRKEIYSAIIDEGLSPGVLIPKRVEIPEAKQIALDKISDFLDTQVEKIEAAIAAKEAEEAEAARIEEELSKQPLLEEVSSTEEQSSAQDTVVTIKGDRDKSAEPQQVVATEPPPVKSTDHKKVAAKNIQKAERALKHQKAKANITGSTERLVEKEVQARQEQASASQIKAQTKAIIQTKKESTPEGMLATLKSLGLPYQIKHAVKGLIQSGEIKTSEQFHSVTNQITADWIGHSRVNAWYKEALKRSGNPEAAKLSRSSKHKTPVVFIQQVTDAVANRERALSYDHVKEVVKIEAKKYMDNFFSRH